MASQIMNPAERSQFAFAPNDAGAEPAGLQAAIGELFGRAPGIIQQTSEREMAIYQDDRKLAEVMRDSHKLCFDGRLIYERNWWRNLLYLLNRQWIVYNTQRGQWVDKRLPRHIPKPVTNQLGVGLDTIRSVFAATKPSVIARPIGDSPESLMTAETVDRFEPVISTEHQWQTKWHEADFWLISTGNVVFHQWWNGQPDGAQTLVPFERCMGCQQVLDPQVIESAGNKCPVCGSNSFLQATDQRGQLVSKTVNHGRGVTDVCSPFEVAVPPYAVSMEDSDELIRIRWRSKEYAKKNYPHLVAKNITFEKMSPERSLQLMKSLASQSEISSGPLAGFGGEIAYGEGITEYELWKKPNKQFPQGLVLRCVGGSGEFKIVRQAEEGMPGPLPHWSRGGEALWPWVHVPYMPFGGRFWARSPLDTTIQKQDQLNQVDSLIQLAMSRTANPVWLEPKGAEVKKFTGEPGVVLKYQPVIFGTGAAKPERVEGSTIPAYVLRYREQLVADIDNQLGINDPFKGGKPPGVEAFSAMQLLVERSQTRFTIPLEERGQGHLRNFQIALQLEQLYGPDQRKFAVMGPNGTWTFEAFRHANLLGLVDFLVEDGSQAPKTNLAKRAGIQSLDQLQVLRKDDPDVVYTILRTLGSTDLLPTLDTNIKSALREQDQFERWAASPGSQQLMPDPIQMQMAAVTGQPPPAPGYAQPLPFAVEKWHDHMIHIAQHKKWANSDAAIRLFQQRQDLKQLWAQHLLEHEMAMANEAMFQQMLMASPAAVPAVGGAPGAGQTMPSSNNESGNVNDVGAGS